MRTDICIKARDYFNLPSRLATRLHPVVNPLADILVVEWIGGRRRGGRLWLTVIPILVPVSPAAAALARSTASARSPTLRTFTFAL